MDIGKRLKELRESRGLTLEQVGSCIGVNKATVQRYENGNIDIKRNIAIKLAECLSASPAYIMGWEDYSFPDNISPIPHAKQKPRLGTIACGEPILAEQNVEDYDRVPDWAECDFTLKCKGDSMTGARIFDGDIVCIRSQPEVENGEIAAVLIDDEATLKRVYIQDGRLTLMPENPSYQPLIYVGDELENVRILGKATYFISAVR